MSTRRTRFTLIQSLLLARAFHTTIDPIRTTFPGDGSVGNHAGAFEYLGRRPAARAQVCSIDRRAGSRFHGSRGCYRDERQPSLTSELLTMPDPYSNYNGRPKPTGRPHQGDGAACCRFSLASDTGEILCLRRLSGGGAGVGDWVRIRCHLPGTGPLPECR